MATMLRRSFPLALMCVLLTSQHALSQTITSTGAGGNWEAAGTWIGGVIPSASSDVVVAGPVGYATGSGYVCRNLTVNSGGSLFNRTGYAWPEQILTVNGSVTNNGTIRNEGSIGLVLRVKGNISNSGTWTFRRTELNGAGTQTLTAGSGKMFESAMMVDTTARPTVAAGSDCAFTAGFDLGRSTLDMKTYSLTLQGSGATVYNGFVVNTKDLVGKTVGDLYGTPVLDNITYSGTMNLRGYWRVNFSATLQGNVTVVDTVENYAWYGHPEKLLTIAGNLINNGLIRNGGGNGLALIVTGNATNNGKWIHNRTDLSGTSNQILSLGTNKLFEAAFKVTDSLGMIVAGSNFATTSWFDLRKCVLDMNNYSLTLQSSGATVYNGLVINTKDLVGKMIGDVYGTPILDNITYNGSINARGFLRVNSATLQGDVTVTDTVQNSSGYGHPEKVLTIVGNIINNGLIRNGGGNGFALKVTGNVTNNGKWIHNRTDLSGTSNQILSLGTNKLFEAAFKVTDSLGMIVAGSNLATTSWFDLRKCVLDMKIYSLTLQGSGATVYNGLVINTNDLVGRMVGDVYGTPILDNITYNGSINARGFLRVNSATLQGNVTVTDTVQNSSGYGHPEKFLKIIGSLTNNGVIRDGGSAGLVLDVTGDLKAIKAITNKRVQLAGSGNRTLSDKISQVSYVSTGEKVILFGENYLPNLSISTNSRCLLASGSNLYVPNSNIDEKLENWSTITSTRKATSGQSISFFKARVTPAPNSTIDSVKVSTSGHQVPSTFSNAVKSWWRLDRTPKTGSTNLSTFTMSYSDEELGQNVESGLQVYSSSDSGKSWRQISTSLNLTRNAAQNSISITDVQTGADYLLSSSPDPLSVRPTVIVTVIGRTQIRVGPPNRYTVQYVNNSDVSTGDMLISLIGQGGVFIKQVEPSMPAGMKTQVIPIDSLTYRGKKDSCLLWVQSMAPREERTFDVVLNAVPDVGGKLNSTAGTQIAPFVIAAAWWVGEAVVAAYVTNVAMNVTENIWRPVAPCETLWEGFKTIVHDSFKETNKSWFGLEKPAKAVMDEAKGKLREKMGLTIPGEQLLDAAEATMKGAQRYLKGDFKVKDCSGAQKGLGGDVAENGKSLQKVTSWDPNEKIGPTGFGTEGFMSSAGKMTYQILFENKKEATAPAWRIVIVDTLQADYDATTVEFGKTSHDGPEYQWVKTRVGNILQWSIEGIELPPNVVPPQGEGYVMFSVSPKSTIASGTKLRNRATITFDLNKPIATNEVVNTLDFTPPTTVMRALATTNNRSPLAVRWQSSDGATGAGVKSVTIYASKDGGPFVAVGSSSVDSLLVPVANGDYRFYGLAADYVGNVELLRPPLVQTKVAAVVDVEDAGMPLVFALYQNYPNPFNPTTEITFSLSAKVRATLRIYDMLGREITTLLDEEKGPGKYTVKWDAGKNSSGVYFYRLIAGDASRGSARSFVQTRKLMLLR